MKIAFDKVNVTPNQPCFMAGYSRREKSQGVLDPIEINTVAAEIGNEDGVCKVNIWTALERDASPKLLEFLVHNASKAAGPETVEKLIREGYLTEKCGTGEKEALAAFTTVARQDVIFRVMKDMVREYLEMWYVF